MTYDRSRIIQPPWVGWDESLPSMWLPPSSFKQITGWLLNKGRIQHFPNLVPFTGPPDGEPIQGASSFTDVLGFQHTGVLTKDHAYYLSNTNQYLLQGSTSAASTESFAVETFLNRLFYANGVGFLNYLDGSQGVNVAGDVPGSCFVLGKVESSLVELNLFEAGQLSPLDIRWCGINTPTEWNSAVDPTAGRLTISEAEDQINGFSNQRGVGVIFRQKGITLMSPTGSLLPRFNVASFEAGPTGVGEFYQYTLGNYGDMSIFAAENDIYLMQALGQPQSIGGRSKKAIYQDLASMSAAPWACFLGKLGIGVDYLAYWLNIPLSNNSLTSTWVFHLDDQSWVNEQLPYGALNWMGDIATA